MPPAPTGNLTEFITVGTASPDNSSVYVHLQKRPADGPHVVLQVNATTFEEFPIMGTIVAVGARINSSAEARQIGEAFLPTPQVRDLCHYILYVMENTSEFRHVYWQYAERTYDLSPHVEPCVIIN